MEISVFMTSDERVELLNELIRNEGCRLFVASEPEDVYRPLAHVAPADLEANRSFEIGYLQDFEKIAGKRLGKVYRTDRVGFVTASMPRLSPVSGVLLETNFHADPSPAASAIGKAIRKHLKKSAYQGVLVCTSTSDDHRLAKNVYWTEKARESKRVWKQAENSLVFFVPAPRRH
jgi:hypothetical protein